MDTSSRCPLRRRAEPLSTAKNRTLHVRIPGLIATLHTSTAVIFTKRLRGVKTCSLYTKGLVSLARHFPSSE